MPRPRRNTPSPVSRRRFLGGAGALALAAAFGSACDGDDAPGSTATPTDTAQGFGSATTGAGETATPLPAGTPQRGQVIRFTGLVSGDGVYDPHKTQAPPFAGLQAAAYSRLIAYSGFDTGIMEPDLAAELPEQPEETTYVFELAENATWHDTDPLNGRPVTAEDVRYSIERQRDGDGSFPRKPHWVNVEAIETPDDRTVIVRTEAPLAPMLHYFADVNAFIVAPELFESGNLPGPNQQVGSGPFTWVEWNEGEFASLGRNPDWFGGAELPFLDGLTVRQPVNTTEVEALLRTRQLDLAILGRAHADRLKASIPDLIESTVGESRFWGMRFQQVGQPWSDVRFRRALTYVVDRREMLRQFFGGSGEMNPWISWPVSRWTLPQQELQTRSGYRTGTEGRAADIAEAKQLLQAVRDADVPIPDTLTLTVLDQAESVVPIGQFLKGQIEANLGLEVNVSPVTIDQLSDGLLGGDLPWVAGPDSGWIDLDDWIYPYFHSSGTKNTFALRDEDLDAEIASQRTVLDPEVRRSVGLAVQRHLLNLNLGINFISERTIAIGWPYVHDFPLDIAEGYEQRLSRAWIDTTDPHFAARA